MPGKFSPGNQHREVFGEPQDWSANAVGPPLFRWEGRAKDL